MTDTQKQNIENMRLQGVGYKRIAGSFGMSEATVKSFCQRNNLSAAYISVVQGTDENKTVCKQCGKTLEQKSKTKPKTFCCNKCRYDYWNASTEQRQAACHTICACCGTAFVSYESKKRKYCGHSCYIKHRFPKGGIICDKGTI